MDSKLEIFIGIMARGIKYKDGFQMVERQTLHVKLDA